MTLAKRPVALLRVEEARAILAECKRVDEAKDIRDKAGAVERYLREQKASTAAALDAGEIKLRAERRLGELLAEQKKKGERQPAHRPKASHAARVSPPPLRDLGITHSQSSRWQQIARIPEETFEKLVQQRRDETRATTEIIREHVGAEKLEQKRAIAEQIRAEPPPMPEGPFRVIAIDPPWKYDSRSEDATHRGRNLYPEMTTSEICTLPVAQRAHQDGCVLWLWTTNAFMREAFGCLDSWGFQQKTILTWDKELLGLGDWLRNVTEHCLLAVRGRPLVQLTNQTTLIHEPRREHSRKPEAFYSLVEALCPGSKLEMFARSPRPGWTTWGAEPEKFEAAS